MDNRNRIDIYSKNPHYWQYKGKPLMLLGGSVEDNLYQIANLEGHLDLLQSVGGNYVRCTMSCRDEGDVWPFAKLDNGLYDLNQWNDEHWQRFENFLKLTLERDIIPQIEIWAYHDLYEGWGKNWSLNPYNPKNNINYTAQDSRLSVSGVDPHNASNRFFWTVPELDNNTKVLQYQQRFVDKLLTYALDYDHVLYCMTNEIHPGESSEWSLYWARYIHEKAISKGVVTHTTEMFWQPDLLHEQHRPSHDHPEIFSFFEAAQNSANRGAENWRIAIGIRQHLNPPRPINNVKVYGNSILDLDFTATDKDGVDRFWRNIFAGHAATRFHRPDAGLGLGKRAQVNIKSARMLTDAFDLFTCAPYNEVLREGDGGKAYVLANPSNEYAFYVPDGLAGNINLPLVKGHYILRWLDINECQWVREQTLSASQPITLKPPSSGQWAALMQCCET